MTAKHTPGPWRVDPTDDTRILQGPNGLHVAYAANRGMGHAAPANARLIAAAPELLDALRGLYDYARCWPAEDGSRFHRLLVQADAALRKAEGETP